MGEPHYSAQDAAALLESAGYTVEQRPGRDQVRWHLVTPAGDARAATDALLVALARNLHDIPSAPPALAEKHEPPPKPPSKRQGRPQKESPRLVAHADPYQLTQLKTGGYTNVAQNEHGAWTADHSVLRSITAPTLPALVQTAQMCLDQARFALLGTPRLYPDLPREEMDRFTQDRSLREQFPNLAAWLISFRDHERGEP